MDNNRNEPVDQDEQSFAGAGGQGVSRHTEKMRDERTDEDMSHWGQGSRAGEPSGGTGR